MKITFILVLFVLSIGTYAIGPRKELNISLKEGKIGVTLPGASFAVKTQIKGALKKRIKKIGKFPSQRAIQGIVNKVLKNNNSSLQMDEINIKAPAMNEFNIEEFMEFNYGSM